MQMQWTQKHRCASQAAHVTTEHVKIGLHEFASYFVDLPLQVCSPDNNNTVAHVDKFYKLHL